MTYPQYSWSLEPTISFSCSGCGSGAAGNPALAMDSQQNTYFASIEIGQNPTASINIETSYQLYYNVAVGSADQEGTLLWYKVFPELIALSNQTQVTLALGSNNDLYVAFVTPTAVNNCYNMSAIPLWCPPLYPSFRTTSNSNDVVLARINYTGSTANVAWVLQNAQLNSVWDETVPQVAVDGNTGLLYIAYQTTGDILCNTPVGTPNIAVACFSLTGKQLWLETQENINSTGANTSPAIITDTTGGVYIAYQTTKTVSGGAIISNQQIEMVKFQTYLSSPTSLASYSRQWVLSQYGPTTILTTGGTSSSPSLTTDNVYIYIAFLTTGSVAGSTHTGSTNDLVVAKITQAGSVSWIQQGQQFNRAPYTYANAGPPYITSDFLVSSLDTPSLLVSLPTYSSSSSPVSGNNSIFVFKLIATTGANMFDISGFNTMPFAYGSSPLAPALFPTTGTGNYSQVAVKGSYRSMFFLLVSLIPLQSNTLTSCYGDLILIKYNLATVYPNITPFQFMSSSKKLCSCGASCSCNATTITVPSAPTNLVAIPGNTTAIIYFTINDGNSPIINFAYSLNGGTSFTSFSPGQSASPLTISGLTNGTTYNVQIKATNGIGTGSASSTVTVTPGVPAPPTNVTAQPGNGNLAIYFTPGAANVGTITNYLYSLNGGAFTPFSPAQTTSPITIGTLTNGTTYSVQIAPVNSVGTGPASSTVTTIVGTPTSPTNLVGIPSATSVSVTFTGSSDNGSAIITYAYSINGGMSFIPTHPNTTTSPIIIGGLVPNTTYNIQLAATNTYGLGAPSATLVIGT